MWADFYSLYIYKQKTNGLSEVMHKECLSIDSTGLTGIFSERKEKKRNKRYIQIVIIDERKPGRKKI